jgi:uncharacterized protein HemY
MNLAAQAFATYQDGVQTIAKGDFAKAERLAGKATFLHNTATTHNLTLLTKWLMDNRGTLQKFP